MKQSRAILENKFQCPPGGGSQTLQEGWDTSCLNLLTLITSCGLLERDRS